MELLIFLMKVRLMDLHPDLNSNMELLIFTNELLSFSATETFKFQYGATNIET